MNEQETRENVVRWGRSLFERGLTSGSSGNISVRVDNSFIATPTNSCLGFLEPDRLSKLNLDGLQISGDPPTKELPLHLGLYRNRPGVGAVVHLHATYSTALSCLADSDAASAIPPVTPYAVMRLGRVPVVPYTRPGAAEAEAMIGARAAEHSAMLLQNHGPIVSAETLDLAVFAIEELEEAAKLVPMTRGMPVRFLSKGAIRDLGQHFGRRSSA